MPPKVAISKKEGVEIVRVSAPDAAFLFCQYEKARSHISFFIFHVNAMVIECIWQSTEITLVVDMCLPLSPSERNVSVCNKC
jgi:hypothetical protein